MSIDSPEGIAHNEKGLRFGILAARFNQRHVDSLLGNVLEALEVAGVTSKEIETIRVPGSHEIPYAVSMLATMEEYDCIIALGVIIAGDTQHHEVIAQNVSQSLQSISIETGIPIINGIILAHTQEQADVRCMGEINRGEEFAHAALEMAKLKVRLFNRFEELEAAGIADDEFFFGSDEEDLEEEDYPEDENDLKFWKT